jgi:nitric oxide reductase large subunit
VNGRRPPVAGRFRLVLLFVVLLVALGVGVFGTIIRPPAYEVRGVLVARLHAGMILVRHDAVAALEMGAMELMAVAGDPPVIDAAGVVPGDPVRLAVRRQGDEVRLIRIEKIR